MGQLSGFLNHFVRCIYHLFAALIKCLIPRRWYAKDVSNDIVLITGAGSGLGREIALQYARLGSSIILWDINTKGLEESKCLVEEAQEKWIQIQNRKQTAGSEMNVRRFCQTGIVDVSNSELVQQEANKLMKALNANRAEQEEERFVSVLVNNAGIYHGLLLEDLTDKQIERVFKINMLAHFWTVRAFLPHMKRHERGHIVEIASMGGIAGLFKQVDYCATKFATVGFEESLNLELDYQGLANQIHTTVVCPFFFSSNLFTGFNTKHSNLMSSEFVASEAVLAMRCNHACVLLPKFTGHMTQFLRSWLPRKAQIELTKALQYDEQIKDIKGKAATAAAS